MNEEFMTEMLQKNVAQELMQQTVLFFFTFEHTIFLGFLVT